MAKIIVCNNIFDAEDVQSFEAENKSVKEFLYDINLDKKDCSNLVEIYDPDTGKTSFVPFDDDGKRTLNVNINVNGKQVSDDYILQKTDLVVIQVLPASDVESAKTGLMIGGALTTILAVFALTVLTGGIGSVAAGAAATTAIASLGGMTLGTATHLAVAAGFVGLLGAGMFMAGLALEDATSSTKKATDDAEKLPDVSGSNNQSIVGNAIPVITGKVSVSPFIIGNPYNELETGAVESSGSSANSNITIRYVRQMEFTYSLGNLFLRRASVMGYVKMLQPRAELNEPVEDDCTITMTCTHPATVKYKYEVHRGHTVSYETREKYTVVNITYTCVIKAGELSGEFTPSWVGDITSNNVDLVWYTKYSYENQSTWVQQPIEYFTQGSPTVNVSVTYGSGTPVTTTFELNAETSEYSYILTEIREERKKAPLKKLTKKLTRDCSYSVPLQDTQPAISVAKMFGETMSETLLLAVGYAPVFVKNITLDSLPIVKNKNNVLSGLMTYSSKEDGTVDGSTDYLTRRGVTAIFNGKNEFVETEAQWNTNKVSFEVSQFNQHRSIYPYVVKQQSVNAALLYCYDGEYQKVAQENTISWQGGTFPVGMRTNTIYLSKSVPRKITVGIDFPSGLYRTYSKDGDNYYQKIPMNLVIQWRPYYKYLDRNDIGSDNGDSKTYDNKAANPDYTSAGRYGLWRNFDSNQIVPQITYTSSRHQYVYYHIDGHAVSNGTFYGKITSETELSTMPATFDNFIPVEAIPFLSGYNTAVEEFAELRAKQLNYIKEEKKTVRLWYTLFIGTKTYVSYNYDDYTEERQAECTAWAKAHIKTLQDNAETDYISRHNNEEYSYPNETTSAKEIALNDGLSENTDTNSNPTWNGVRCFSFGKFSCGKTVYQEDPIDPSLGTSNPHKNPVGCKDQIRFEVSATLTQEDILDLINKNPKTIEAGNDPLNSVTYGQTECVLDSVQVRVIRLTPCYIDSVKEDTDKRKWTYSDVVKWSYLKTETLDKRELLDDIETSVEVSSATETGAAPKIDCNPDTYQTSGTWNTWDIGSYRQTPMPVSDLEKMTTIGVKVYPDKVGYISGTLSKIGVDAYAITPALKQAHIRYWRHWIFNDGTDDLDQYAYYDSYDDFTNKTQFEETKYEYPVYSQGTLWKWATAEEFNTATLTPLGDAAGEYYYERMAEPWEKRFYPEKVEIGETLEAALDNNGNILKNELGETVMETVYQGNDWTDYIYCVMSEHKDSLGRWIATDSFLSTFTEQNAIAQALNLAVCSGLGKDAKGYNSLPHTQFVTYWRHDEDTGMYYKYDSDDIEPQSDVESLEGDADGLWKSASEGDYNIADKTLLGQNIFWSWRKVTGTFNMLALKEAYEYTDAINIGNGAVSYKSNNYIYQQKKFQDLLQQILYNGRAFWFYDDIGRIEIHNDRKLKNPVLLITDENSISSSNTRSFAKAIAGYHVMFKDEKNGGQEGELYVLKNGQTKEHHTRDIVDLNLDGITNELQARDFALYMLAQSVVQRETWTRKLNHVGGNLTIGSLVELQSSTLEIGTDTSGRIQKLLTDGIKIYGFIADNTYIYQDEYNEDGSNVQGCTIMQLSPYAGINSRTVAMRFASQEQQENGITVPEHIEEGVLIPEVEYHNEAGATNLILLAKPIIIEDGRQENQTKDYDTKTYLYTVFRPSVGDVIAFGDVGKTTSPAIVSSLSPDESGHISVQMFPYYDEVYDAAHGLPIYSSNLSRRARSNAVPVPMEVTRGELQDTVQNIAGDIAADVSSIIDGTADVGTPDRVEGFSAVAGENSIELSWYTSNADQGLKNTISYYTIEYTTDDTASEPEWISAGTAEGGYAQFSIRERYYEASAFKDWAFRIKATNLYGEESLWTSTPVDTSSYLSWIPAKPSVTKVDALKDGISLVWRNNEGSYYGTKTYDVYLSKDSGSTWGDAVASGLSDCTWTYTFDRSRDGYPEWSDFGSWLFKVTARNESSNSTSSDSSDVTTVNYGTWIVGLPDIRVENTNRTLFVRISKAPVAVASREIYGNIRSKIQIQRQALTYTLGSTEYNVAKDMYWYAPKADGNPYSEVPYVRGEGDETTDTGGSLEYRGEKDGWLAAELGTFSMVVPLFGQDQTDIKMVNTPYKFKVKLYNEAGEGNAAESGIVTADCSALRDMVKANVTAKKEFIEVLSAITANLGEISQGSMSGGDMNYWTLSDKENADPDNPRDWQGAFSVGDDKQYIRVTPLFANNQRNGYKIEIKAGNIEFTGESNQTEVIDAGTYVYSADKTRRMRLSQSGIEIQAINGTDWTTLSPISLGNISIDDKRNLVITNASDVTDLKHVTQINDNDMIVYHLNDTITDQNGQNSENMTFTGKLISGQKGLSDTYDTGSYEGKISKIVSELGTRSMVFLSKSTQLRGLDSNGDITGIVNLTTADIEEGVQDWNDYAQANYSTLGFPSAPSSTLFKWED